MEATPPVRPNKRGQRSRELVLETAERLMAENGYEAATVSRLVEEAGIPPSSVYHYFGSKDGVLLAVLERGAERFFAALPEPPEAGGTPLEAARAMVTASATALNEHPDFLRLLVVMAAQPPASENDEVRVVITRIRDVALGLARDQLGRAFELDPADPEIEHLARFTLAAFDGAFVAHQADPAISLEDVLSRLPEALVAIHEAG